MNFRYNLLKLRAAIIFFGIFETFPFVISRIIFSKKLFERLLIIKIRNKYEIENIFKSILSRQQANQQDLVSVIIPVNNGRSHGIEHLINSLKKQTHKNIEFIAIDSGSTDDTVSWLKSNNIKVIEIHPNNFNHAYSRNIGAKYARGKYILFTVDDANFYDPNWLVYALGLLKQFQADSLSSLQIVDSNAGNYARYSSTLLKDAQSDGMGINISKSNFLSKFLLRILPFHTKFRAITIDNTNHLTRRELFNQIKFNCETVEDLDFGIKLSNRGYKILYTNLINVLHYHKYENEYIQTFAKKVYLDNYIFFKKNSDYYFKINEEKKFIISALLAHEFFIHFLENSKSHLNTSEFLDPIEDKNSFIFLINNFVGSFKKKISEENYNLNFGFKTNNLCQKLFFTKPSSEFEINAKITEVIGIQLYERMLLGVKKDSFLYPLRIEQVETFFNFLWVNYIMTILGLNLNSKKNYIFSQWKINQ
jgi:glycosyltransferase involved in cell wall biosynthesis